MKRKIKYSLMGIGALAVCVIPLSTVLSCTQSSTSSDESTTGSFATNSVVAISHLDPFDITNADGTNILNDIALNINGYSSDNLVNTINNANIWKNYGISSVATWNYSDTGELEGIGTDLGLASGTLTKDNGTAGFLAMPSWLQRNNSLLVADLFSNVLNYISGSISMENFLGQANSSNTGSLGMFKLLYLNNESSFSGSAFQTFANALSNPLKSTNGSGVTYYLRPAYIFYSVGTPNNSSDPNATSKPSFNNAPYYGSSQSFRNLPYDSILASYMPSVPSKGTASKVENGATTNFNDNIAVSIVYHLRIVYEYYYEVNHTLVNLAQTPSIRVNGGNYDNPYYQRYFLLNLNPIYVALQNLGRGGSGDSTSIDQTNYAALNYYGNTNPFFTTNSVQYNWIQSNGTTLVSNQPSDTSGSNAYLSFLSSPASAWCFDSRSINSLYTMQQQAEQQAKLFYTLNQNYQKDISAINISSQDISLINSYFLSGDPKSSVTYN